MDYLSPVFRKVSLVMFVRCTRKKAKEMSGNENADERMFVGQQILQGHTFFMPKSNKIFEILNKPLDILFLSNHNIHKSLCGICFWASDPFIKRF